MWTERDQIQAYQFLRRRLVSALAAADANHPASPNRRLILGTVLGGVGVLLVTVGFGVVGLLKPAGAANWRQPGQVILEEGSGAHFVLGKDGLLHPVINEASAVLLAGTIKTVSASATALSAAPLGATLGIVGAPDSLPPAAEVRMQTLVTCSSVSADQPAAATPTSAVLLAAPGRDALARMNPLGAGRGLLVRPPGGPPYLIADGYRYRLPQRGAVVALGYQGATALPVAANWLDTLPAGRDLNLLAVPQAGRAGPNVDGPTRVGQVYATSSTIGGKDHYYLVRSGGLEPITQTEAVLVLGDKANEVAYPGATPHVVRQSVAMVTAVPQLPAGADAAGYPAQVPTPVTVGGGTIVVCAAGGGRGAARVAIGQALPLPAGGRVMPTGVGAGAVIADQVDVPLGSGALLAAQIAPGAPTTATYLVTDEGEKFPLANAAARSALGYGAISPVPVSPTLLRLLPTGPPLDPAAAQVVVSEGSTS